MFVITIKHITSTCRNKQKNRQKMEIPAVHSNVGISNQLWGKQVKH